jgi:UDP-N-acetylmuramoyl-tripeptide--D-alanyl-D-alanine ligase
MRAAPVFETEEMREFFDRELTGFSIDSRTVVAGQLFFALSPEDYRRHYFTATTFDDAHRFIPTALERGAAAVVARRERVESDAQLHALRPQLLLVDDVIEALQRVARGALEAWGGPIVAITGSAGKTTAKDLTAHVLTGAGRRVLKTQKNFNNELGLALSILQMETSGAEPADYDVAVLELGQSMFGEIGRLTQVAPPDIAVELNVAPVHLEFFDSIEQIAEGKAQLIENLKPGGTAILNADDARVAAMRDKHRSGGRTLTFGLESAADVTATAIESERFGLTRFRLRTPLGEAAAELPLPGRHNLLNALAAAAVATCFEIAPEVIAHALASASASEMRGEVIDFAAGFTVIDDSYNSNPRSLLSMARAVAEGSGSGETEGAGGRTIVIAGEMLELGATGAQLHRETGREMARMGIAAIWGVRGLASELVEGAREAGMNGTAAKFFPTTEEAAAALLVEVRKGDLVLVKGSRGVRMERIVELLRERYGNSDG